MLDARAIVGRPARRGSWLARAFVGRGNTSVQPYKWARSPGGRVIRGEAEGLDGLGAVFQCSDCCFLLQPRVGRQAFQAAETAAAVLLAGVTRAGRGIFGGTVTGLTSEYVSATGRYRLYRELYSHSEGSGGGQVAS